MSEVEAWTIDQRLVQVELLDQVQVLLVVAPLVQFIIIIFVIINLK